MASGDDEPRPQPETHRPCRRCRAWVEVAVRRCDLCGAGLPARWLPPLIDRGLRARHLGLGFGGAIGAASAISAIAAATGDAPSSPALASIAIWAGGALGAVGGLSVGGLLGGWLDDNALHPPGPRPLVDVEAHLRRRVAALEEALAHIDASRKRLHARLRGEALERGLAALDAAERASRRQLERHTLDRGRAALVRLHNRLEPAAAGWRRADRARCERFLGDVSAALPAAERLHADIAALPAAATSSGQRLLQRVAEVIAGCEALRDALLLRQAAALAEAAPGIAAAFDLRAFVPELGETSLAGGAARELVALTELLPQLDEESQRLEAELAAIDEVAEVGG